MRAELATADETCQKMRQDASTRHASSPDGTSLPLRLLTPPDGSFGAAVRAERAARGWTAAHLARLAGCDAKTIRDVERDHGVRRATAARLAGVLGVLPARPKARHLPPPATLPTAQASGALLRRWRLRAGLSQNALAERAGVHCSCLNRLESGDRRLPTRQTVEALATALDLDDEETDDLLLAAGHLPSWSGDVTVRQCAALLACLPGPAARRLREQVAAAYRQRTEDNEK